MLGGLNTDCPQRRGAHRRETRRRGHMSIRLVVAAPDFFRPLGELALQGGDVILERSNQARLSQNG